MLALLVNNRESNISNLNEVNVLTLNLASNMTLASYGEKVKNIILEDTVNNHFIVAFNDLISESTLSLLKNQNLSEDIILIKNPSSLDIESLEICDLLNLIKAQVISLPSIICITKEFIKTIDIKNCRNYSELCLKIIFSLVLNSQESLIIEDDCAKQCNLSLDNNSRAKLLRDLISESNIEDLFPNNNWNTFSKESAAVAYHTLCAMFIKFDDLVTAQECLNLSTNFEDSPRALALRGLIALKQKQDLNAVANMVSSLHIYEKRKKEDNHLVKFKPQDLDVIGEKLSEGLDALNNKDNYLAAKLFADAICNFDDFFKKQEIDKN